MSALDPSGKMHSCPLAGQVLEHSTIAYSDRQGPWGYSRVKSDPLVNYLFHSIVEAVGGMGFGADSITGLKLDYKETQESRLSIVSSWLSSYQG